MLRGGQEFINSRHDSVKSDPAQDLSQCCEENQRPCVLRPTPLALLIEQVQVPLLELQHRFILLHYMIIE